jgi:hypothetical protein
LLDALRLIALTFGTMLFSEVETWGFLPQKGTNLAAYRCKDFKA